MSTDSKPPMRTTPQTSPWRLWGAKQAEHAERRKLIAHVEVLRERAKRFSDERDSEAQPPLFDERDSEAPAPLLLVRELLDKNDWKGGEGETLNVYADELEELIPLIADYGYLRTVLASELYGWDAAENIKLATVFDDATLDRLRKTVTEFDRGSSDSEPSDTKDYIAQCLSLLCKVRANRLRHERLMAGLRPTYLGYQITLIGVLVALFFLCSVVGNATVGGAMDPWARFVVVATTGALGSVLAATLKLRDIAELNPFRGVAATTWIQPLIGASIGLISWMILASGALKIGGIDNQAWQTQALVAFASGFSEPLFFGIVGRVMGAR